VEDNMVAVGLVDMLSGKIVVAAAVD